MNEIDLRLDDGVLDVLFSNFVVFFFPDARKGAKELDRTLKPGGTACQAACESFGWLPVLPEMQKTVQADDPPYPVPMLAKWHEKETMTETLKAGGILSSRIQTSKQAYTLALHALDQAQKALPYWLVSVASGSSLIRSLQFNSMHKLVSGLKELIHMEDEG
ncbi:MAG: hypothetical protein Q9201_001333 [Fulgogasparrea decipioides]